MVWIPSLARYLRCAAETVDCLGCSDAPDVTGIGAIPTMLPVELHRLPLFAAMTRAERAMTAAVARSSDYPHGARLFRTGDACSGVIVALDGYVRLFRLMSDGAEVTTEIVQPGGLVAVAALRGGTSHDGAADALGRVRTVEIPAVTLLGLMGRSPQLFAEVADCLAARISHRYADAVTDAQAQLPARILHTLCRLTLVRRAEGDAQAMRPLAVRLSHAELARLVGVNRASVTRTLRLLEEQGAIRRRQGHVTGVVLTASIGGAPRGHGPRITVA